MLQNKMDIPDVIYKTFIKKSQYLIKVYKKKLKKKEFEPKFEKDPMSSDQEIVVAAVRATKKLTIDSEQQERREQEEKQRLEEIQKRKEEKRKRREEAEREEMERIKQQEEKEKKYDQPQMMFVQDSDDGVQFKRVVKKIKRIFPNQVNNFQAPPKKKNFIVPDDEDGDQSESESGSYDEENSSSKQQSNHKKGKKDKAEAQIEKKEKKVVEKKPVQKKKVEPAVKKEKVKVEPKSDRKQQLVKQVSVRWWYALPEWPPIDFDYTGKLKELGYRALNAEKFKLQPEILDGLEKVQPVDGYLGVYKSKTKLIDIRPKQSAPTLNNFRSKSSQQLTEILKKALTNQIQQLKQIKHQQKGQKELLVELQRQLNKLK